MPFKLTTLQSYTLKPSIYKILSMLSLTLNLMVWQEVTKDPAMNCVLV